METIGDLRIHRSAWRRQAAPPWLGAVGVGIGVALAYLGTALLSLAFTGTAEEVGVFWPAAGVAAGALLICRPAARWPVLLAIVAASAATSWWRDQSWVAASIFALREGGQALLLAWFAKHQFAGQFRLDSLRSVLGFAGAAGAASAIAGSLATAAVIAGRGSEAAVVSTWCNSVPAAALGIILVVPVLLGLRDPRRQPPQNFELLQGSLTLAALAGVSALAIAASSQYWYSILPLGLLLPVLLAAYGRPLFAAAAVLVFAFIVARAAIPDPATLAEAANLADRLTAARATLLAISICTLVLAALFAERRRHEAALKLSNERLQLALDAVEQSEARLLDALAAGQVIAFEWSAQTGQSRRSENATVILGPEPVTSEPRRNDFFRHVHADDRDAFRAQIRQLRPERPGYAICFRFCCRDGREVWLEEEARGEFDAQGKLVRVKGLTRDISERKRAELAIAERTLQLTLAGKAALVGSFAYATDNERMQISDGYAAIHGYPDGTSEIACSQWRAGVHPQDVARLEELRTDTFRQRRNEYGVDYRIVRDGEVRWIDARCFVSYRSDGRPHRVVGVNIDVTERKRAEQQQRAMNAELDHRVKNVLATINAIIMQTETMSSHREFVSALDGRIRSLARTHELLSQSNWRGVLLAELVRREFAAFAARPAQVGGPSVVLKAESTQALAIVLHELTTNAVKYGAFSTGTGRVRLHWCWIETAAGHRLAIDWQETGGPTPAPPQRSGYGISIVRELIPFELGGVANLTFARRGLQCQLQIPAYWIASQPPSQAERTLPRPIAYN